MARVGVDVGGTFTDVVVVTEDGVTVEKHPSTPNDPAQGVLEAVSGLPVLDSIDWMGHGTTVATNAVLEKTWAETALITTQGCRDVLEIGRQDRPALYDLSVTRPPPIVPRDRRFEITERLDERGNVLTSLSRDEIAELANTITNTGADALAISLLFSFENDAHERELTQALRAAGIDMPIARSSQVLPEIREYERTVATALNAALQPVVSTYLDGLEQGLQERGISAPLRVMQSNGGTAAAGHVADRPVTALLSGPAAGVEGAAYTGNQAGYDDLITMDMGGTSCDVALIQAGEPTVATDVRVGAYTVGVPSVEIETIGAGGGSIAWVDPGGALRVGPRSAGAVPGPICYDRGGENPTITDAHVLLGRLSPTLVPDASVPRETLAAAFESTVGNRMEMAAEDAAAGVLAVANANMAGAIRVVSVERGHDPRSFALVSFGGAGPLHAAEIAESLDIPRVIVPPMAGVLSAVGLLVADRVFETSRSRVRPLAEVDLAAIQELFDEGAARGRQELEAEGVPPAQISIEPALDLRYVGQSYEVRIPMETTDEPLSAVAQRFHTAHERRYGHHAPDEPIELVTIRLRARGTVEPPEMASQSPHGSLEDAWIEDRAMFVDGTWHDGTVYDRQQLPAGTGITGPAVLATEDTTIFVPPEMTATGHPNGAMIIEVTP